MKIQIQKTDTDTWCSYISEGSVHNLLSFKTWQEAVQFLPAHREIFKKYLSENIFRSRVSALSGKRS